MKTRKAMFLGVVLLMVSLVLQLACAGTPPVEPSSVPILEFTGSTGDENWYQGEWHSPTFTLNLKELGASQDMGVYVRIMINVNDGLLMEESGARVELMHVISYSHGGEYVQAVDERPCYEPRDFDPEFIGFRRPILTEDGRGLPMPTTSGKDIDIWEVERERLLKETNVYPLQYKQLFEQNYFFVVTGGYGGEDDVRSWTIKVFVTGAP